MALATMSGGERGSGKDTALKYQLENEVGKQS